MSVFCLQRLLLSKHIVLCTVLTFSAKLQSKRSIARKQRPASLKMSINNSRRTFYSIQVINISIIWAGIWGLTSVQVEPLGESHNVIDKIQNRLSGWKQQCLSFAGRLTLSKSILSSIPYYHMQYAKLPKILCNEMEKIQRSFLWGDTDLSRKPHLVGWDICCLPKNEGDLGIKRPHHMNDAFLMKMLWNLITKPNDLWCKVLYSKYGRNKDLRVAIDSKSYDSPLWKALTGIWKQFQQNIVWQLGNGNNINFWMDKWAPNGTSLMSITNQTFIDTTLHVRDVVTPSGEWDFNFLTSNLPSTFALQVFVIPAPKDTDGLDNIGWGGTNTRDFTIQSAYDSQNSRAQPIQGDWKALWSWKGPHRIQTFMWTASHERCLTNYCRSKWGVGVLPYALDVTKMMKPLFMC